MLHYVEPKSLELPDTYPRNQFNDLDALDLVSRFVSSIPEHSALLHYGDIVLGGGKINLIYPFLKLGSVRDYMQKFKLPFLNEVELKAGTFAIVDALNTLHQEGFVHAQVEPSTVMFTNKSKFEGFTVALRKLHECQRLNGVKAPLPAHTVVSMPQAHKLYLSAEMHRGKRPSPSSDIWSLGVTLY